MYLGPDRRSQDVEIRRLGEALHDLCQPMTTLQCRLEIAEVDDTPEAYEEAVRAALPECVRVSDAIHAMREIVRAVVRQGLEQETGGVAH